MGLEAGISPNVVDSSIPELKIFDNAHVNRAHADKLLADIKRAEKKSFSTADSLDFDTELKKRNSHLVCSIKGNGDHKQEHPLIGYMVYARTKRTALLHKICVLPPYRRQGIARQMMTWLLSDLTNKGCDDVQLWVAESNESARALYASLRFEQIDHVTDYYAPGRAGIKMILHLQST